MFLRSALLPFLVTVNYTRISSQSHYVLSSFNCEYIILHFIHDIEYPISGTKWHVGGKFTFSSKSHTVAIPWPWSKTIPCIPKERALSTFSSLSSTWRCSVSKTGHRVGGSTYQRSSSLDQCQSRRPRPDRSRGSAFALVQLRRGRPCRIETNLRSLPVFA